MNQTVVIFGIYTFLRLYGVYTHDAWSKRSGMDTLALAAVLIFPRLAFATLSSNLMVLYASSVFLKASLLKGMNRALRSLIVEFMFLMSIACFCFAGFLYALWT